jgi:hypothetical protein
MAKAKRKRSRSTKKGKKRRGSARGPWGKKVFKAKNGATYVKNRRGQVKFLTGASKAYMARIRRRRGKGKRRGRGKKK